MRKVPGYDHRERRWRHLDPCQLETVVIADVPRVKCSEDGVVTMEVPWAETGSSHTGPFERWSLRHREQFRNAIYFHLGGLDLYPKAVMT